MWTAGHGGKIDEDESGTKRGTPRTSWMGKSVSWIRLDKSSRGSCSLVSRSFLVRWDWMTCMNQGIYIRANLVVPPLTCILPVVIPLSSHQFATRPPIQGLCRHFQVKYTCYIEFIVPFCVYLFRWPSLQNWEEGSEVVDELPAAPDISPGHQVPKRIHSKGGCSRDLHRPFQRVWDYWLERAFWF